MNSAKRFLPGIGVMGLVLATLAACGGGGGSGDNSGGGVSNTPPASASADVPGFIAFLKVLVATSPETTEPLDVTAFVAPTSDNTEPDPSI